FASFAIPFAFACAALMAGRADASWIRHTRRFALLAWSLQTTGLLLGMWWAYHVLGWGGYWGWDPVENVALMPWLATTAYLHSSQVQARRGRLRLWNFGLVIVAFLLVVFGTFIVRSGVVPSVHTFAISAIGPWFLAFLFICMVFSAVLLTFRSNLGAAPSPAPAVSREGAFLLQNLLLLGVVAVVLWGTVLPLVSGMLGTQRVAGAPYYERAAGPLFAALLALLAVGPLLPWRRAGWTTVRAFRWTGVTAAVVLVVLLITGVRSLEPSRASYAGLGGQALAHVAISTTPMADVYVVLAGTGGDGSASFTVFVNPLVTWIWAGGAVIILGVLLGNVGDRGVIAELATRRIPVTLPA